MLTDFLGYYEGWSTSRPCDGSKAEVTLAAICADMVKSVFPEGIPSGAYTHLNYAFAFVDPESFAVAPMSDSDIPLYLRFTGLKANDAGLQTWISIGGWSMNDADQPTAGTFSKLAGSAQAQSAFFASLLSFLSTYGFDGVDVDWLVAT